MSTAPRARDAPRDAPDTRSAVLETRLEEYHAARRRAARVHQALKQKRTAHKQRLAELDRKFEREIEEHLVAAEDADDALYDFRRHATRVLRQEVRRIRRKNLPPDQEKRRIDRVAAAFDAQVHPDDELTALQRAAVQGSMGGMLRLMN